MKNNMEYQKLYDEFMQKYKQSETTPTEAGETLARIAGYFPSYNLAMVRAERDFSKIHSKILHAKIRGVFWRPSGISQI